MKCWVLLRTECLHLLSVSGSYKISFTGLIQSDLRIYVTLLSSLLSEVSIKNCNPLETHDQNPIDQRNQKSG